MDGEGPQRSRHSEETRGRAQHLRVEKTHDLEVLIARAIPVAPTLKPLLDEADLLTPYAVAYRYPGDELVPTTEEFAAALVAAEEIVVRIASLLGVAIAPSS